MSDATEQLWDVHSAEAPTVKLIIERTHWHTRCMSVIMPNKLWDM